MSKRFRLVQSLTQSVLWSSIHAWQESHQEVSEQEVAIRSVSCSYGTALAQRVQAALEMREQWHIQPADLVASMLPALRVFDELHAPSSLGGSIASSLHGMQQMAQDIDLVVDLPVHMLPALGVLLEQAWQAAIRHGTPYNVIHLNTMLKIDLIPLKRRAFTREEAHRAQPHLLEAGARPVRIASSAMRS